MRNHGSELETTCSDMSLKKCERKVMAFVTSDESISVCPVFFANKLSNPFCHGELPQETIRAMVMIYEGHMYGTSASRAIVSVNHLLHNTYGSR
jgi:hypothetical protein